MPTLCFLLKRELNNIDPEAQVQFLKQKQKQILKEKKNNWKKTTTLHGGFASSY